MPDSVDSDVLVIGGGIAGLSLAAALGAHSRVVLLEREQQLFTHTSGRSARQSQPTYGPAPIRRFTAATLDLLRSLELEGGRLLTPRPLVWVDLPGGDHVRGLFAEIEGLEPLTVEEAVARFPALRPEAIVGAALDPASVEIDVDKLKGLLVERAERSGATIALGTHVVAATRRDGTWIVETEGATYRAPVAVVAAGPWADSVAELFGARGRGLVPTRRTVVVAAVHGQAVDPGAAMVMDAGGSFYLRPSGTEILASSLEDEPSIPEDAQPRPGTVERTLDIVNRTTLLQLGSPYRSWTGLRTLSADGLPVVGWDDSVEGLYWLAGQGGYGIQTSLGIAAAVTEVLSGGAPGADLVAFDPARVLA